MVTNNDGQSTVERAWVVVLQAVEWEFRAQEDLDKARALKARALDLYERVLKLDQFPGYVEESGGEE